MSVEGGSEGGSKEERNRKKREREKQTRESFIKPGSSQVGSSSERENANRRSKNNWFRKQASEILSILLQSAAECERHARRHEQFVSDSLSSLSSFPFVLFSA